jgi:hypothetical protein
VGKKINVSTESPTFTFARAVTYENMNLYAVKMAAVFMISTSTLARTGFTPRWIVFLGLCLRASSPVQRALY